MILVISNIANDAAPALVNSFPAGAASLIMASDVFKSFKAGIAVNDFLSSDITLSGTTIPARKIRGVVTTIPCFLPQEFYYVTAADREYVCAELQAFFIYFLSELKCKKLNPPGRKILTGLSGHKFEWLKTARHLHIPVLPLHLKNGVNTNPLNTSSVKIIKCTVVGDEIVGGEVPDRVVEYTRALSRAFSLSYISCFFATENGKEYY
ncbi:MAG TPA: hypothetical protein VFA55_03345, partial [Candidatus Kapabacteria bacterium]|nr:hypothetical protein [Candidatus Kapabacteria bacterium]